MPTYKQKIVASKLVENGGNIGKAMVAAGYSPATAKTPQKLTDSQGWQELMKDRSPVYPDIINSIISLIKSERGRSYLFPRSEDDNAIKEIIENKKINRLLYIRKTKTHKIAYYSAPDYSTRSTALHLICRIMGLYATTNTKITYEDPYEGWTMEELDAEIERLKEESGYNKYKASIKNS